MYRDRVPHTRRLILERPCTGAFQVNTWDTDTRKSPAHLPPLYRIPYVNCFGRTVLYVCIEYYISVNMYHVSAQGIDERMINVHYYYYYLAWTLVLSVDRGYWAVQ